LRYPLRPPSGYQPSTPACASLRSRMISAGSALSGFDFPALRSTGGS